MHHDPHPRCIRAGIYGAAAGLMMDMLFMRPGIFAIQFGLCGLIVALITGGKPQKKSSLLLEPLLCAGLFFIKEMIAFALPVYRAGGDALAAALVGSLLSALSTAALSLGMFAAMRPLYRAMGEHRERAAVFVKPAGKGRDNG